MTTCAPILLRDVERLERRTSMHKREGRGRKGVLSNRYQDMQSLASRTLFYEKMAWNLASGDEAVGESGLLSLVHGLKAYLFLDSLWNPNT